MCVIPTNLPVRHPHTCEVLDYGSLKCLVKNDLGQFGLDDNSARGDGSGERGDDLPFISL